MDNRKILNISRPADREAVAMALYRSGYSVREVKRKEGSRTVVYIEYWKEERAI